MKEIRKEDRTSLLVEQLLDVWERSVRETHLFLSDGEIEEIKKYVPAALTAVPDLIVEINTEKERQLLLWGLTAENWKCCLLRLKSEEGDWEESYWNIALQNMASKN